MADLLDSLATRTTSMPSSGLIESGTGRTSIGDAPDALPLMPQLDALRAIAVLAVLAHHYVDTAWISSLLGTSPGLLGVRLFFVLSGFLITRILLQSRKLAEDGTAKRGALLKQFYIRRSLRIFPLYYLVLLGALLFGDAQAGEQLPWLATYTYNFWIAHLNWFPAYFSHFWSLAVEEQFYLLWPAAILFVPRRCLVLFLIAVVLTAPIYRWIALENRFGGVAFYVLTPSSLDALGLGALLALLFGGRVPSRRATRTVIWVGGLGAIGWFYVLSDRALAAVLLETMIAFVFVAIVAAAAAGFRGRVGALLEARPVLYLGRISYGVYAYHVFLPDVVEALAKQFGYGFEVSGAAHFFLYTAITIAVASLSWYAYERPINQMKRHFTYGRARQGPDRG